MRDSPVFRWFRQHFFLLIAIGFSLGYPLFRVALVAYLSTATAGDPEGVAQATQIESQWVAMPGVASKLLIAIWFFTVANVMAWASMRLTDVLPKWAKGRFAAGQYEGDVRLIVPTPGYKETFLELTGEQRLVHYEKVSRDQKILFAICLLAAALIQ